MKLSFKSWSKTKKAFAVGATTVFVMAATVVGFGVTAASTQAASCPTNDIMPCGASSRSTFISKLKNNNPSDMNNIYANYRYDLPTSQYDEFAKYAKAGRINPDNGNITVDGKTVGYDGLSLGRNPKSNSTKITIDSKTYYQSHIKDLTRYYNDAMVLFDSKGNVQTVIMNICGNPIKVTPNNPKYECDALYKKQISRDTFEFTSKINASNGASVVKVVYDFGDGSPTRTETSPSTVYKHTYTKPGTYTAKVTAYVKTTFGRTEFPIKVTSDCKQVITVKEEERPKVAIDKKVDGVESKQVEVGQNFTYQLKVTNTGNVDLTNVAVKDDAPANVQFVSATMGEIVDNKLVLTLSSLKVAQEVNINIVAKVTKYVPSAIVNNACVDAPAVPGTPDDCDEATVTVPTPKVPHVKIDKVVNGVERDEVAVGESFIYTLRVTNNGEVTLASTVVTDTAPADVTFISSDKGSIVNNALVYTTPPLAVGASIDIKITAKLNVYKAGDIVNKACVDAPAVPGSPDECDEATITTPKPKVPHVKIDKLVNGTDTDEVAVGEVFTYTVKATNDGEVDLKNVLIRDPAPTGVTLLTSDKGAISGNVMTHTEPSLKVNESVTIKITAKVNEYKLGAIVNTACVDAPEVVIPGNPADKDDCDDATVTVQKPKVPGIFIDKVVNGVNRYEAKVGEVFTYTLTVKNTGEVELKNVVVTDPSVAGVTLLTTDKGVIANNALRYTIDVLPVNTQVQIKLTAKVETYKSGDMQNTACVDAPALPGDKDDCDDATVTVPEPGKVRVCNPATGEIIWVPLADQSKYEDVNSEKCKPVKVCDPADGIIKEVKWADKDKYESVDSPKCSKMQVCVIADGTGAMITISKDQFDATKHSTSSADCRNVSVCRLSDKTMVTVKESAASSAAYSSNPEDCKTVPQVLPAVLPATGAGGAISLATGVALIAGIAHRLYTSRKFARNL